MSVVEESYRDELTHAIITPTHVNTDNYNTFGRLLRRTWGELQLLKMHIVENSKRVIIATMILIIIRIVKMYNNKLRMIKKYVNKLKH